MLDRPSNSSTRPPEEEGVTWSDAEEAQFRQGFYRVSFKIETRTVRKWIRGLIRKLKGR